jgi:hypothetical protein
MNRCDKIAAGTVLGVMPPLFCALAGWWGSIPLVQESHIWIFLLAGFILGILIDVLFLRRWVSRIYQFGMPAMIALYLFYTLGVYGFCMGVPVFNLAIGALAGVYIARRERLLNAAPEMLRAVIRRTATFTAGSMIAICAASATFACFSKSTPRDLQSMLRLPFTVTWPMITAVIVIGGISIVCLQFLCTIAAAKITLRVCDSNHCEGRMQVSQM